MIKHVLGVFLLLIGAAATAAETPVSLKIARLVESYYAVGQFNGAVLVAERGRVAYRGAIGFSNLEWNTPNTPETKFEIASMTKPMTAILIMQLVEEGKVMLNGAVAAYVPYLDTETGRKITVEQLLAHSSGLQQDIAFSDDGEITPLIARINADRVSNDELVREIMKRPLRFEPGTGYGYSSDAYAVLGAVIEHVTGRSYDQTLRSRILDPVGMRNSGPALLAPIVPLRAQGYAEDFSGRRNAPHIGPTPAGYLYSTLDDLYAWERALSGDRLLTRRSKEILFAPRKVITAYGWKTSTETWGGTEHYVLRTTGGLPGFQNLLVRVPDLDRTIIILSNIRGLRFSPEDLAKGINQILDGLPYEQPKRSLAMAVARTGLADPAGLRKAVRRLAQDGLHKADESEMNSLGYHFLGGRGSPAAATAVFEEIVRMFPASANAHDSLGEAYAALGERQKAIASYKRSLALNPQNKNAEAAIAKLSQTKPE